MRIAVISDTHDRYPAGLPERLRGADEIWHLGDVCAPETLVEFLQLGPPLRLVMGNCDAEPGWPLTLDLRYAELQPLEHAFNELLRQARSGIQT